MDKLFTTNVEDTEVYDCTKVETENLRDNPPSVNQKSQKTE